MIEIGKIVKPQGIHGEVKIVPQRASENYKDLRKVFIENKEYEIETISCRDALYIKFSEISDRNNAETLRGKSVYILEDQIEHLSENEFYFKDLIGAKVLDEKKKEIGTIEDIEQFGAADVIIIRERNMLFSVPFLDSVFKKIESGKVFVSGEEYDNLKINY